MVMRKETNGKGEIVPCTTLLDEILELVAEDADALGCAPEIAHLKTIMQTGTSAHRQLATYSMALSRGTERQAALVEVVDMLIEETKDTG